jgi:hypothetical protein
MIRHLLAILLALAGTGACDIEVPSGTIRPVDEYCFVGLCADDELCDRGVCYAPCERDAECSTGCCLPNYGKTYCAPTDACR